MVSAFPSSVRCRSRGTDNFSSPVPLSFIPVSFSDRYASLPALASPSDPSDVQARCLSITSGAIRAATSGAWALKCQMLLGRFDSVLASCLAENDVAPLCQFSHKAYTSTRVFVKDAAGAEFLLVNPLDRAVRRRVV